MLCKDFIYSAHSITKMFARNISADEIENVVRIGEIIADYPQDKPYPSNLILGFVKNRPIHVVLAKYTDEYCIVITAYEPDKSVWNEDFKTKKRTS